MVGQYLSNKTKVVLFIDLKFFRSKQGPDGDRNTAEKTDSSLCQFAVDRAGQRGDSSRSGGVGVWRRRTTPSSSQRPAWHGTLPVPCPAAPRRRLASWVQGGPRACIKKPAPPARPR
jgi:hypothetical protein